MKNKKTGFTLIELMVAIAIIGILAGVVMVSMSSYGNKARATNALRIAENMMPAAMECSLRGQPLKDWVSPTDGGGNLCDGSDFTWTTLATSSTKGWVWGYKENSNSFYALCSSSGCLQGSGAKQVVCSVSSMYFVNNGYPDLQPGACIIVNRD